MKNNELRVEYPPKDVVYAGGKSPVYPGILHSWRCGRYKREATLIPSIEDTTIGKENQYGGNQCQNQGNRPHPNLSYRNRNNVKQPPPGFSVTNGLLDYPKNLSLEKILKKLIDNQSNTLDAQDGSV